MDCVFAKGVSSSKSTVHGKRGEIEESPGMSLEYSGFFAEADGFEAHWEHLAERIAASAGALLQLSQKHPWMTFSMRREVYVAKVRGMASFGPEIWGWKKAQVVQHAEEKGLCVLLKANARTKPEAMLWLSGLLPPWVSSAQQAFIFLVDILDHGDVLERATLSCWKQLCQQSAQGWCHDMLLLFMTLAS